MTAETAVTTTDREAESRRKLTLLKAVGLDRVSPEQRELALAIAKRYDLDLLLKHLVLVDGRPYVTRDGLLHIAHRSGQLDGIETTDPAIEGDFWRSTCSVFRKDMSHPFRYAGRYPVKSTDKGFNAKFAPEMALKVAESMSLRRAFDISAPSIDERWDAEMPAAAEPEAPRTLAEKVAEKAATVTVTERTDDGFSAVMTPIEADAAAIVAEVFEGEVVDPTQSPAQSAGPTGSSGTLGARTSNPSANATAATTADTTQAGGASPLEQALAAMPAEAPKTAATATAGRMVQCESTSPFGTESAPAEQCRRELGHPGPHKTASESWPA